MSFRVHVPASQTVQVSLVDSTNSPVIAAVSVDPLTQRFCFDSSVVSQTLVHGQAYSVIVDAFNGCTQKRTRAQTNGFTFVTSPPIMGTVRDGDLDDCGAVDLTSQSFEYFAAHWDQPTDVYVGVKSLAVQARCTFNSLSAEACLLSLRAVVG